MKDNLTKIFKALADDTRLQILEHLANVEEMSCQELMKKFSLSQPTLSHHFNKLVDADILESEKNGVLWIYRLNKKYLKAMGIDIKKLLAKRCTL